MQTLAKELYMLGLLAAFFIIWYLSSKDDRLLNLIVSLPGIFAGTFEMLWRRTSKLEKRIIALENRLRMLGHESDRSF
jgi:hypothetical protein